MNDPARGLETRAADAAGPDRATKPMPDSLRVRRVRPLVAWRAIRELIRNPDDTAQVFTIIGALSGRSVEYAYERFRRTETGRRILAEQRRLVERLDDRETLLSLPESTLGHQYARFVEREQISAGGLAQAGEEGRLETADLPPERRLFADRLRDMHDLWHVVTGYGRDLVGEAALLAFTYAQTRNRGIGFIVLVAYLRARSAEAAPFRRMIRRAFLRGRRAQWLPAADWEALLERPLDEVRRDLGVGDPPRYEGLRSAGAPALA